MYQNHGPIGHYILDDIYFIIIPSSVSYYSSLIKLITDNNIMQKKLMSDHVI